ncbi:glycosyltransferase [Lacinutrix neustonica]|uniref:Glycosyltransferase n=1 Tax=Lacinutrix neustonica TaxID=2980107 RepID=A0A9E8MYH4_9FLAO|nr:glycosyltransferase [Lacinutrix neustonica]WAC03346.1 glycosyltransferase [Lacinutrix neustonica]
MDCLTGGGAEKAAALLSESLYDAHYEVSIIVMKDLIDYSFKGTLYNIRMVKHSFLNFSNLKKLFCLRRIYKKINADVYLDFRVRYHTINEVLLHLFVFKIRKTVFTIHSYKVHNYLPKKHFFYHLYNKAKAIVVVSEGILEKTKTLFDFDNLICIPNFYNKSIVNQGDNEVDFHLGSYIIAVGRLKNEVKQFDKLILAYANTIPAKRGILLVILGEGKDHHILKRLIEDHHLESTIKLLGFKNNPYPYIKKSQFLILSSKVEGCPMVLVEALALETVVVSFNCKSGPAEIITHEKNGLLVRNQDFNALKMAIDRMYTDSELYLKCKKNTKSSVYKFSDEVVFNSWLKLINT